VTVTYSLAEIANPISAIVTKGIAGENGRNSFVDTGAGAGFSIRQPQEFCSFFFVGSWCEQQQQHSSVLQVEGADGLNPHAAELAIMNASIKLRA
jgi:hypothetical protein